MGIPKFFRYISKRYPCILELIKESEIPDFDNLYLDMNGIFHNCFHKVNNEIVFDMTEEEVFQNIFNYIDILFNIIRPKKLLFMAVDGVAPRAKMNQQRSRRFRSAKERELMLKNMAAKGEKIPENGGHDSNCISPGTEFMVRLQTHLEYYINNRLTNDSHWKKCKVILSGHQVPGEGEHKIMEYIRYMKTLPDYDPYTRHCFYGLDADLVILGLCSHEINFSILREEVKFGKQVTTRETKFYLLHLSLLKEYLDLEFKELKSVLPFEYNLERIIDDWVLMGFIAGNDFIPHLPHFHINKGALEILYKAYIELLPSLGGYLNESGYLNLSRFQTFMERLAKHELESFEEIYANLAYLEEKTGRRANSEKDKENEDGPKDPDLERLIAATNEGFSDDDDMDEDDENDDDLLREFSQHKRDYYTNKLDYFEVTDEVLKSQAEGYIRGIQWILHYYYHGCKSWGWYYPHHYAPCTSDIVNFKDVNLNFEVGQPFLPYQQLLAILPPRSKDLLPKAYQDLMVSEKSPIKHYYPDDFETDLNGKQHEWEAVVLLPFIDEKDLLSAMESCNGKLTEKEKKRNTHGPMLIYSYVQKSLGVYKAPGSFPDVPENHASAEAVWQSEIAVDSSQLAHERRKPEEEYYFPGFPTFRYKPFEISKEMVKIGVLQDSIKSKSIIIKINQAATLETEAIANELLGKSIYVNWPYLREARVVGISDRKTHYPGEKGRKSRELTETESSNLSDNILASTRNLSENFGIRIGETEIVVYVNVLKGVQKICDTNETFTIHNIWSDTTDLYPLQTIVKSVNLYEPYSLASRVMDNGLNPGTEVFMLDFPFYGCMGRVIPTNTKAKNSRVRVKLQVPTEPKFDRELLSQSMTMYYSASMVGQKIGISPFMVAKITGSIMIDVSEPGQMVEKKPVNIGLRLRFNKWNEEVPGYTKKDGYWMYSDKALEVMREYVKKYTNVVDYVAKSTKELCRYPRRDIFPDPTGADDLEEMLKWLKGLECASVERVTCGSQVLEKDIVMEIEKIVDSSPKETIAKFILVKPQQLYQSDLLVGGLPPVPKAEHQLFDRIISVKPFRNIPLGLRGYIIGILKGETPDDCMYDILYDEPVPSGMTLNCSPGRGYRTSSASFINISHGERSYQLSKHSKSHFTETSRTVNPPTMIGKERPSSAFAQWNNHPPAPAYRDRADQFKFLWSYLEKSKSQDETKVLKKILKIEDEEEKPKIEDNVKTFFENISKNAGNFKGGIMDAENVKIVLQKPSPENQYKQQLSNYFKLKNLPPPNYHLVDMDDKMVSQVILHDSNLYTGFPSADGKSAQESAAQQALYALGELKREKNPAAQRESESDRKMIENQARLEKALFKTSDADRSAESAKSTVKQKATNDKLVKSNKSQQQQQQQQQQNHRRNNVPHNLPTPPPQWCRQSRTSAHTDQYRNSPGIHNEDHRQVACSKTDYSNTARSQDGFDSRPRADSGGRNANSRQDCYKTDHPNTARNQKNHSVDGRQRADSGNGFRNSNWRQEEKMRIPQSDVRPGNESARNNWRQRQNKTDQFLRLWPENHHQSKQGNAQDKSAAENNQVGVNGVCQRLPAVATEFIPLQALTRSRNRGGTQTKAPKPVKTVEQPGPPPSKPPKLDTEPSQVPKPSSKPKRKSKIAAKFDADWDPVE